MAYPQRASYVEALSRNETAVMNMRNFAIWAVIGVVLFGIYGLVSNGANGAAPTPIGYSDMLDKIASGQVKQAILHPDNVTVVLLRYSE